jgi:hypothetical protein
MPFCVNCGNNLDQNARFCSLCGTAVNGAVVAVEQPDNKRTVHRCPACNGTVSSLSGNCPFCGSELSNTKVADSVHAFFERMDALDQQAFVHNTKKEEKGPWGGAIGAAMGLDAMVRLYSGLSAGDKRKLEMIQNFPVPNSKEDIMEFLILSCSRVDLNPKIRMFGNPNWVVEKKEADAFNNAWTAKIKQVYYTAQIAYKTDTAFLQKIEDIIKQAKVKV